MADFEMDDIDLRTIRHLENDGRMSFREIARDLDVSEATVRARVRRLRDAGVLQIVAFANPAQVGRSQLALLLIQTGPEAREALIEELCARTDVSYVSTLLGRATLFVQVLVRDIDELWQFVHEYLERHPGVTDVETLVEVQVHKLHYATPAPE